ncbi:potassium:hydrogen antiporter [Agrocybe pediades]|nr:potassium:hydrogen antiporter [Agrocybe pediades]
MGEFSDQVLALFVKRAASEQGGVISGDNPAAYSAADPFKLWVIQVIIILAVTQTLGLILARIRQPRVIAEVIGGVLLGPTVLGRIPGFLPAIFPDAGMASLTLTSTIGLVFFLFLVGLEIDTRVLKRNILASTSVSLAGLIIPLGLGAALGVGIYREYISQSVNFGHFLLFVAVAIGITAFPVLCRILTELKLLDTEVGLVTLSAGIGNDVVGWVLLALTVALVNASSKLTALWILLAGVGYTIMLLAPGKWAYVWLAKRTGSLEQGSPTVFMMTVTLVIVLVSAFFTDIIGIHPIFGGFLAGLIIPHENGYAISLVEKLEDLVSILFLPIYFTLSGLKTNLSLLNEGKDWGYIVLICLVAFSSKFFSCGIAAYCGGFNWRESGAIGSLMSCKGLVELIVLNIGLQAKILDPKTFSMFVVHALILTFMTTPLVLLFYPARYRVHHKETKTLGDGSVSSRALSDEDTRTRFSIVLDKIESLPAAMTLSQLLKTPSNSSSALGLSTIDEKAIEAGFEEPRLAPTSHASAISVDALRLMELTNRTSAVLRSQEADSLIHNDPVVTVYRTFGQIYNFNVTAHLSVVNFDEFPETIAHHVAETNSQMVFIPWPRGTTTTILDEPADTTQTRTTGNPFDGIFHRTASQDQTSSVVYSEYIRKVFSKSTVDTALFVDRGAISTPGANGGTQHLFLAFFGGPDDRLALKFLVQLCRNPLVTATVIRMKKIGTTLVSPASPTSAVLSPLPQNTISAADTYYGQASTQTRMSSDTADNILWERYTKPSQTTLSHTAAALSSITFRDEASPMPLHHIVDAVKDESRHTSHSALKSKTLIVLAGRSRRMAVESLSDELRTLRATLNGTGGGASASSSVPRTLGDVGAALAASGVDASILVLQAAPSALS